MPRREPERSSISWADVEAVMSTYAVEYGVRASIEIHYIHAPTVKTYAEVVLYGLGSVGSGPELVRVRGEFNMRRGAGQAGSVMHALYTAINEYDRNPWLWTPERRALVTGETV